MNSVWVLITGISPRLVRRCASRFLFKRYLVLSHCFIPRLGFFWVFLVAFVDFFFCLVVEFFYGKIFCRTAFLWLERLLLEYFRVKIVVCELGWCIAPILRKGLRHSFYAPSISDDSEVEAARMNNSNKKHQTSLGQSSSRARRKIATSVSCFSSPCVFFLKLMILSFCGVCFWCYFSFFCASVIVLGITIFREACSVLSLLLSQRTPEQRNSFSSVLSRLSFYGLSPQVFGVLDACILVLWASGAVVVGLIHSGMTIFLWKQILHPFLRAFMSLFSDMKHDTHGFPLASSAPFTLSLQYRTLWSVCLGGICTCFLGLQWIISPSLFSLGSRTIDGEAFIRKAKQGVPTVFMDSHLLKWDSEETKELLESKKKKRKDDYNRHWVLSSRKLCWYVALSSMWTIASVLTHTLHAVSTSALILSTAVCGGVVLSSGVFWLFPAPLSKFLFFTFLREVTELKVGGLLEEIYTNGKGQLPDPYFLSPFFVFTVNALLGKLSNIIGITVFYMFFWKCNYRATFYSIIILSVVANVFCHLVMLCGAYRYYRQNSPISPGTTLSESVGESTILFINSLSLPFLSDHTVYICGTFFLQLFHSLAWIPFGVLQDALLPPTASKNGKPLHILQSLVNLYTYFGMAICSDLTYYCLKKLPLGITAGSSTCLFGYNFGNVLLFCLFTSLLPGLCLLPLVRWSVPSKALVGDEINYPGKSQLVIPLFSSKVH